jgi:hypothetical protein
VQSVAKLRDSVFIGGPPGQSGNLTGPLFFETSVNFVVGSATASAAAAIPTLQSGSIVALALLAAVAVLSFTSGAVVGDAPKCDQGFLFSVCVVRTDMCVRRRSNDYVSSVKPKFDYAD